MRKKIVLSGRKKIRQKNSKPGTSHFAAAEALPLLQQEEAQKAEAQRKEARKAEAQRKEPLQEDPYLTETDKSRCERMGLSGNRRIRSSMTLFWLLTGKPVFRDVLDRLFDGKTDENTARLLQTESDM